MAGFPVAADDEAGVTEHSFELSVDGEPVPGLIWRPAGSTTPRPAVLIGHGRTGHKRTPYQLSLARRLARRGWTAVALDAPGHGERRPPGAGQDWPRPEPDQVVLEWQACLEFLRNDEELRPTAVGYWGVSMGTGLGIPLLARETGMHAAVLGMMHPNWPAPPGARIRADARKLTAPVLFLINWDDSRAPRAAACELFDLIGSTDKRMHAYPGEHGQLTDEAVTATEEFLARYLGRA